MTILCLWCRAEWSLDCVCCMDSFEAMVRIREREMEDLGRLKDIEAMDDEQFTAWWESHSLEEQLSQIAYMGQVMQQEDYEIDELSLTDFGLDYTDFRDEEE